MKNRVTTSTYKKINWSEISYILTGSRTNLRFNEKGRDVPRKYWRQIDEIIFKELPTFWYQYKLALRKEQTDRRRKANIKRKGIKYKMREKVLSNTMKKVDDRIIIINQKDIKLK